jgi:arylsulfatase A-like enzyme
MGQGAFAALFDLIDDRPADGEPIFVFLHSYEIHAPYQPPLPYQRLFGTFSSRFLLSGEHLLKWHRRASELDREDIEYIRASYDGGIRFADDMLRAFFTRLEGTGFLSNAVVIVTSDHGEEFGQHGGLLHGAAKLYEELIRVPLIISGTGVPVGEVVDRLVSSIDIAPTILAVAGIESDVPMMGRNLLAPSTLRREEEVVFSQWEQSYYSVRTRDWKLIANNRGESPRKPRDDAPSFELYDLRADPGELRNLAERFPSRVVSMEKVLDSWLAGVTPSAKQGAPSAFGEETLQQLKNLGYIE